MDLLPERSSDQFRDWLELHPGVQIISRDRGDDYIKGATIGAPHATQVADRFHLIHNLHEALVRAANRHHSSVSAAAKAACAALHPDRVMQEDATTVDVMSSSLVNLTRAEQTKQANRVRRLQLYEQVITSQKAGKSIRAIARELRLHRSTVRRFVNGGCFPERAIRKHHRGTDTHIDELQRQWEAGCHNAAELTRRLQAAGASVSYHMVRRCVADWRHMNSPDAGGQINVAARTSKIRRPSSKRGAWILMKQDHELEPEKQALRAALLTDCPALDESTTLAHEFMSLMRDRRADDLDPWIALASTESNAGELRRFAEGLTADLAAVRAALTLSWSNGQVEGQVNRLKLIKRQMYGRANFDLLRTRFLYAG